jgi:hypothetical protein
MGAHCKRFKFGPSAITGTPAPRSSPRPRRASDSGRKETAPSANATGTKGGRTGPGARVARGAALDGLRLKRRAAGPPRPCLEYRRYLTRERPPSRAACGSRAALRQLQEAPTAGTRSPPPARRAGGSRAVPAACQTLTRVRRRGASRPGHGGPGQVGALFQVLRSGGDSEGM